MRVGVNWAAGGQPMIRGPEGMIPNPAYGAPFALAVAPMLTRGGAAGRRWWALVALPLAVPAPLVGIGLILFWNRPSLGAVYGGAAMPVLMHEMFHSGAEALLGNAAWGALMDRLRGEQG